MSGRTVTHRLAETKPSLYGLILLAYRGAANVGRAAQPLPLQLELQREPQVQHVAGPGQPRGTKNETAATRLVIRAEKWLLISLFRISEFLIS